MLMSDHREGISIRPFRPQDQAAAKSLILAGLEEHWGVLDPTLNPDLDDIAASYDQDVFVLAWRDEQLVGTGALIREAEGVARIVRMSVARELRRLGIGSLMLDYLLQQACTAGYRQIVLETTSTWEDAIAFYQRHGFEVVGERDGDSHFMRDL